MIANHRRAVELKLPAKDTRQGCIKLTSSGWGRLVPSIWKPGDWGRAVPTPRKNGR
jgi:hypothetical protein